MENQNGKVNGKVQINGKTYQTVAYRLSVFREKYPIDSGWNIETECLSYDDEKVIFKATIKNPEGKNVATGHAHEKIGSNFINQTNAYENCETSAVGRALANAGFIGSEFASAEEVAFAIQAQASIAEPHEQEHSQPNQEASPEQAEPPKAEAKPESQEAEPNQTKQNAEPESKANKEAKPDEAQSHAEQPEQNQEAKQPDEEKAERWARENLEEWVYDPCPFTKAQGRTWLQLAKNEGDKIPVRGKPALPRAYLHAIESWETGGVWPRLKARIALEVGKNGNGKS